MELPEQLSDPGILIIWGGSDIHPSLYGRENVRSYVDAGPSRRDIAEYNLMIRAVELKMPIVGVCRGAQMACALAGGILIQHVNGHGWAHHITTSDGRKVMTSSLHHQMMYPWNVEHTLLAWASPSQSKMYLGITDDELLRIEVEPEVVWFPTIHCLAIQGHPEMMDPACNFNKYVKDQVDGFFPLFKH